jgi:hypothetical protein
MQEPLHPPILRHTNYKIVQVTFHRSSKWRPLRGTRKSKCERTPEVKDEMADLSLQPFSIPCLEISTFVFWYYVHRCTSVRKYRVQSIESSRRISSQYKFVPIILIEAGYARTRASNISTDKSFGSPDKVNHESNWLEQFYSI